MALEGGSSGGSSQIRAGKAVVEIGGDTSPLAASLRKAKEMIQGLGSGIKNIGVGLMAGGGAILAPLTAALKGEIDHIKELSKLAAVLGEPIEKVSELAYAFRKFGLDTEETAHVLNHLQRSLSEAVDKPGGDDIFSRLGLDAKELINQPIEQVLLKIAGAWQKIPIAADKARAAQDLAGKQGRLLLAALAKGPEALAKNMEEAGEVGAVVTAEMAKQAKEGTQALKQMGFALEFAFHALGGAILGPATEGMATYGRSITQVARQVREWVEEHKELVQIVGGVGLGLTATGFALTVVGKAVSIIGIGFGPIFKILSAGAGMVKTLVVGSFVLAFHATKALLLGLVALASPIGLAAGLLGTLAALWLTQTESGKQFATQVGDKLGQFFGEVKTGFMVMLADGKMAWSGIVAAIKKGDLEGAASISFAFIKLEWARFTEYLTRGWNTFKEFFLDTLLEMQAGLAKLISSSSTAAWFTEKFADLAEFSASPQTAEEARMIADQMRNNQEGLQRALDQNEKDHGAVRRAARKKDLQDAVNDVKRAEKELKELVEKAQEPPPPKPEEKPAGHQAPQAHAAKKEIEQQLAAIAELERALESEKEKLRLFSEVKIDAPNQAQPLTAKAAELQAKYDADIAARKRKANELQYAEAQQLAARLAARKTELENRLAAVDRDRAARKEREEERLGEIDAQRADRQAERQKNLRDARIRAIGEENVMREEQQRAAVQAAQEGLKAAKEAAELNRKALQHELDKLKEKMKGAAKVADEVRGGFSVTSGQFNFGEKFGLRSLVDEAKEQNNKLDKVITAIQNIPPAAWG